VLEVVGVELGMCLGMFPNAGSFDNVDCGGGKSSMLRGKLESIPIRMLHLNVRGGERREICAHLCAYVIGSTRINFYKYLGR
jgi:hypothetical protein